MNKFTISALAALTIAGTALGMSGATATTQTTVKPNAGVAYTAKPSSIYLAQADGNWYVSNLKWSRWSIDSAKATGVEHKNDCKPTCSNGHFVTKNVNVLLDNNVSGHFSGITVIYSQATHTLPH